MNLTDLTAVLQSRAEALPAGAPMARMGAVRARVRARRRRQAAAVTLIAAGCVATAVLGPNLTTLRADHSTDPAGRHHVVKPNTFDDVLAGDPLTASAVGAQGQREVVLRFTPVNTDLMLAPYCHVSSDTSGLWAATTVNGHPLTKGGCQTSTVANGQSMTPGGESAKETVAAWAALGVVPGRESVLRIQLQTEKGAPRTDPDVRLGLGLYDMTGDGIFSDGLMIKYDAESGGHDYRLARYVTASISEKVRQVSLPLPAGRWPGYLTYGTGGDVKEKDSQSSSEVTIDTGSNFASTSGGTAAQVLGDARAHTVRVRTDGTSGVLLLAYYVRVD
jgi:hypothetical protein